MSGKLIRKLNYLAFVYPSLALADNASYHGKLTILTKLMSSIRDLITKDAAPTIGTIALLAALVLFFRRAYGIGTGLVVIGILAFGFDAVITIIKCVIGA